MEGGKKVLIVEDSQTVRLEVKLILEKIGVTVVEAAGSLGMFNVMEDYGKCVDLIIMDLILKNENGFDLIRKLRETEKYKDVPVIVMTERAGKDDVLLAKELCVSGYLRKPIQKDELLSRVSSIIK